MSHQRRIPPVHALIAFEAAARLGGFAPAAEELCVTPSAVSHRIRQLENMVGEPLFERTSTGVRLTANGQRYLQGVREAFEKLLQLGHDASVTAVMQLRVSSPPTFARNLLIPRLPEFYRVWPDIELEISVAAPMQEKHEQTDVDIRWGNGHFGDRRTVKLFDDVIEALAAPAYRDARPLNAPTDLAHADLLRSPLLPWQPWFAAAGLDLPEPARGPVFSDLGILLEAAASGLGVATCTRRVAARWIDSGHLVPLFGVTASSPSTYYLVHDNDHSQRPEVSAFIEWMTATFSATPHS